MVPGLSGAGGLTPRWRRVTETRRVIRSRREFHVVDGRFPGTGGSYELPDTARARDPATRIVRVGRIDRS